MSPSQTTKPDSNINKKNPNICIVYLVSPRKDKHFAGFMGNNKEISKMDIFKQSLISAQEYLPNYPTIIFHEDYTINDQKEIRKLTPKRKTQFVKINFKKYKKLNDINNWIKNSPDAIDGRPAGYRMMCRFFCGIMQNHTKLAPYDYYIRLDHDSFFNEPRALNVEEAILKNKFDYMYRSVFNDRKEKDALWRFTKAYAKKNNLSLEGFHKLKLLDFFGNYNGRAPYNNFHISKISFWKRKDVQNFLRSVEDADGIIKLHWQDANMHAILLGLFYPKVLEQTDFGYHHNVHYSLVGSLKIRVKHD